MKRIFRLCRVACFVLLLFLFSSLTTVSAKEDVPVKHFPVFSRPFLSSRVLTTLNSGTTVRVYGYAENGFARIEFGGGQLGYCYGALLKEEQEMEGVYADYFYLEQEAAIYTTPEISTAGEKALSAGTWIQLLHGHMEENGLVEICAEGESGYLEKRFCDYRPVKTAVLRPILELKRTGAVTEEEAKSRLEQLSAYFEEGRYWNHFGAPKGYTASCFSVTDIPCSHQQNGYYFCNVYNSCVSTYFPQYGDEMQCLGYAGLLSDLVFGTEAPVTMYKDFDRLRIGDHIRLDLYEHSMVVTDIQLDANGEKVVTVTEVNADYENCQIQWSRTLTKERLYPYGIWVTYFTRYPDAS